MQGVPSVTQHNRQAFCTWINHCIYVEKYVVVGFFCFVFFILLFGCQIHSDAFMDVEPWRWRIVFWLVESKRAAGLKTRQWLLGKHSAGWEEQSSPRLFWAAIQLRCGGRENTTMYMKLLICRFVFPHGRCLQKLKSRKTVKSSSWITPDAVRTFPPPLPFLLLLCDWEPAAS